MHDSVLFKHNLNTFLAGCLLDRAGIRRILLD